MKERKRFLLYYDWENLIQDMSDTDIASLTRGIFKYQNTGEISDMTYGAKLAFSFMRPVFDEDRKDWEEIKKTNSDNAKKRWDKRISEPMRPHANASEPMRASTDNGIDSVNGIDIGTDIETIETIPKGIGQQAVEIVGKEKEIFSDIETVETHGNENAGVTMMTQYLRRIVGVDKFKDSKERWYATHCYNLAKKIGKEEFNYRLQSILEDKFKQKNSNKLQYLYGELKSFIHSPVIDPYDIPKC